MLPLTLSIAGADDTIRPMGLDYIMASAEPEGVTVQLTRRESGDVWPNPIYVEYYTKLTQAYGAAAILAWQDRAVVGCLPFRPQESTLKNLPHCFRYTPEVAGDPNLAAVQRDAPIAFEDLDSKTLVVQCAIVKPELRREGLGTALVAYLVDWAREHGWERIQGSAFIQGNWQWLPDVQFWEKAGFARGTEDESTLEFGPSCGFQRDLADAT
ncbi:MAG: GNAT family N-acetyltransferase [Candidatus Poribacteria bacterium]